jgi:hypothetical protein
MACPLERKKKKDQGQRTRWDDQGSAHNGGNALIPATLCAVRDKGCNLLGLGLLHD